MRRALLLACILALNACSGEQVRQNPTQQSVVACGNDMAASSKIPFDSVYAECKKAYLGMMAGANNGNSDKDDALVTASVMQIYEASAAYSLGHRDEARSLATDANLRLLYLTAHGSTQHARLSARDFRACLILREPACLAQWHHATLHQMSNGPLSQ